MTPYRLCRGCDGAGCVCCDASRIADAAKGIHGDDPVPMFTAKTDSPEDMDALKRVVGVGALERAFGPDGGGMQEIEQNAAIESLKQVLRKSFIPQK